MRPDVIVVGLGSMGAATAYQLAGRGAAVLGLDRFTPPHGRGSHSGGSRIIRMAYAEGAAYVPLLHRAYQLWRQVEATAGRTLLTVTGGLMLGRPDSAAVAGALACAQAHDLGHEVLDAGAVRRRFPAFTPAEDEVGVYEEVAGLLRPEAAVETYLQLADRAGAELRYGVTVTGWRATTDAVVVSTDGGELHASRLVLCPGAWAPQLLAGLDVPVRVQRRVQHYWDAAGPPCSWIWDTALNRRDLGLHGGGGATFTAYGLPATGAAGPLGGAKAAFHDGDDPADADRGAAEVRAEEAGPIRKWLATRLPALAASEWLGGRQCLYALTPDEHFLLGLHPEHEQVSLAAGFSGHGFKFVPVVGEVLADLALTGNTAYPIGLFAPDRFAGPVTR